MSYWAYYNEFDPRAALWIRDLMKRGLIPQGFVDERSIEDVHPYDLTGFTQVHFFAGIAGWVRALQMAGWLPERPVWTGSPPCQPYSVAGQLLGPDDPRHLSPVFLRLVRECKPPVVFGEQVAAAIGKHWLDHLFLNLEDKGYACGSAVLPAASVGAPHKRERLFFGAYLLADSDDDRQQPGEREWGQGSTQRCGYEGEDAGRKQGDDVIAGERETGILQLGHADFSRPQIWLREFGKFAVPEGREDAERPGGLPGLSGPLADGAGEFPQGSRSPGSRGWTEHPDNSPAGGNRPANPADSFWSDADWLGCRDGKFRPVEPGTFPLADGIPDRVVLLKGYGNAIVPQVAAEFIKAFDGAQKDAFDNRPRRPDLIDDDLI